MGCDHGKESWVEFMGCLMLYEEVVDGVFSIIVVFWILPCDMYGKTQLNRDLQPNTSFGSLSKLNIAGPKGTTSPGSKGVAPLVPRKGRRRPQVKRSLTRR